MGSEICHNHTKSKKVINTTTRNRDTRTLTRIQVSYNATMGSEIVQRTATLNVPAGIVDGHTIVLKGWGGCSNKSALCGDLVSICMYISYVFIYSCVCRLPTIHSNEQTNTKNLVRTRIFSHVLSLSLSLALSLSLSPSLPLFSVSVSPSLSRRTCVRIAKPPAQQQTILLNEEPTETCLLSKEP